MGYVPVRGWQRRSFDRSWCYTAIGPSGDGVVGVIPRSCIQPRLGTPSGESSTLSVALAKGEPEHAQRQGSTIEPHP
jgi:hypothetical protein